MPIVPNLPPLRDRINIPAGRYHKTLSLLCPNAVLVGVAKLVLSAPSECKKMKRPKLDKKARWAIEANCTVIFCSPPRILGRTTAWFFGVCVISISGVLLLAES